MAGLLVIAAVVYAVGRSENPATYTADQVASAFNRQGLPIRKVSPPERISTHGSSYLTPDDGAFTVLVMGSDSEAEKDFKPYEGDVDPDNFQLRDANLVVIADYSNSDAPLPAVTRSQIRAAVRSLRKARPTS
jgi:hypothetical protein